jgi:hypothetical protein
MAMRIPEYVPELVMSMILALFAENLTENTSAFQLETKSLMRLQLLSMVHGRY